MDNQAIQLRDIIGIVFRRKILILLVSFSIIAISLFVIFQLPPVFSSTAVVSIEEQQVPRDLVESTVTSYATERIQVIKQRVLTIENIVQIIDKFNLYEEKISRLNVTELSDLFKESIKIKMINADVSGSKRGRGMRTAIAFTVSFEYHNPGAAQKVASEITTLILNENINTRTSRAKETYDFINDEAGKLKQKIQDIEEQIADYKQQFGDSMPELLVYNMSTIKSLEDRITIINDQKSELIEKKNSLEQMLGSSGTTNEVLGTVSDNLIELRNAKQKLNELNSVQSELLNKYSQQHPDVKKVQREIDDITSKIAQYSETQSEGEDVAIAAAPSLPSYDTIDYPMLRSELSQINNKIANIDAEIRSTQRKLSTFRKRIAATPQVERGYNDLLRGLDSTQRKFSDLSGKQIEAELSLTLEEGNMAESFKLLEAARKPSKPIKPNRPKLIALAVAAAFGFAFALAYLLEQQSPRLRGPERVSAALGSDLLMVIPKIETIADQTNKQKQLLLFLTFVIALIAALALLVHFVIMPLDLAAYKALDKLGIM